LFIVNYKMLLQMPPEIRSSMYFIISPDEAGLPFSCRVEQRLGGLRNLCVKSVAAFSRPVRTVNFAEFFCDFRLDFQATDAA